MYPYNSYNPFASPEYNPYFYNQNGHTENPYAIESVTDQFTNLSIGSPSEMQFVQMTEACSHFLRLHRMGHTDEAANFVKTFSDELMKQKIDEQGDAYKLLFSLFAHFSDPLKGLYYLYLLTLYTLPLQSTTSNFSAAFTHNGTLELQIRFQNTTRSLYFPHPFDCTIDPLTQEEHALVNVWLSYFMREGKFTTDPALFEAFLKAKLPESCPWRCMFECEKALFSGGSPSYDLYFDLKPLANLNQFDVARICAQFELRGQIGFDRHEKALQAEKSASVVAWAFIQDSMELAPFAIKQAASKLVQEINDSEVLFKWIDHALCSDKELARILLNHASMLTAKMKTILLLKIYNEQNNPLFDIAIYATLLEGMLEHVTAHSDLKNAAISLHQNFFPRLAAYSPNEAQITSLAITLLCKNINTTHAFVKSIHNLAQSVLEALDRPELALEGSEVLLWHPDLHFTSAIYKSVIDSHIQDEALLPWKNRFFEIAIEIMHTLLDGVPGSAQENSLRLDIVAKMMRAIAAGNARQTELVPIFEKMTFSPLSNYYGAVYGENYKWVQQLYPILKRYFDLHPKSAYKIELIASHAEWEGSFAFEPEEKLSLFNEVLDSQIGTNLPFALQRMCQMMTDISKSGMLFANNEDMKIVAFSKIINAALAMPYAKALTILHSDNGPAQFLQTNKSLLQYVIDCVFTVYCNNTPTNGYPLVKQLTAGLIALLNIQKDPKLITEFATRIFTTLSRAAMNGIFESQGQFLGLLKLCLITPALQKMLQVQSWEPLISTYYQLLFYQPPHITPDPKKQQDLFLQFIKTLLSHKDSTVFETGRLLFLKGIEDGLYHGELVTDKEHQELMDLLYQVKRPLNPIPLPDTYHSDNLQGCCNVLSAYEPYFESETLDFWAKALLDRLANENPQTVTYSLKHGVFLKCTKRMRDPSIFTHNALPALLLKNELKEAYANFLQGTLEEALITNSPEQIKKAIALYHEFFPKLELQSQKERLVTRMATILFCKTFDPNTMDLLARSVLQAHGYTELYANDSLDMLLYHADTSFYSLTAKKQVKSHIQNQALLRWKDRLFEITKDFLRKLLERKPKNDQERTAQLIFVATQINAIIGGNLRSEALVPIFEKMVFSLLGTWNKDIYTQNLPLVNELYNKMLDFGNTYPQSIYKTSWVLRGKEWEQCPLQLAEKSSLFNEVLDFLIAAQKPLALQMILSAMATISTSGSLFGETYIATFKKAIDLTFETPYVRVLSRSKNEASSGYEDIPLLKVLIDSILPPEKQLITHDNKGRYPVVQMITDKLITLCTQEQDNCHITTDEFVEMLFCLWERAATHHVFETAEQYVDMLKLCLSTPLLQKILTTSSWEPLLASYSRLVSHLPANLGATSTALNDLSAEYLQVLNELANKTRSEPKKELLNENLKEEVSPLKSGT